MNRDNAPIIFTIVLSTIFVILLTSFIFSRGGVMDTIQKGEEISQLREEVLKMERLNNEKSEQIKKLKSDENYRKSVVKGLGFEVDEGEYVFRFEKNTSDRLLIDSKYQKDTNNILTFLIALVVFQLVIFAVIGFRMILDIFWR
ncbi:MAG: septum formation initiator family protein [Spirochaetia bacterium]|nr:septum formation initiator family protein [Spirochaetota bacterium]MCX8096465.1 septum formation initiator family protein [Spirochaetota bacterium]MDW8112731.1 septum formation initiator family protein [Spirochaetia bacterium]